jgi:hypothetical protein
MRLSHTPRCLLEKANEAIINAFKEFWLKEQQLSTPETKLNIAICLGYFRRILSISPHPLWSSANEILSHKSTHNKYIIQLRVRNRLCLSSFRSLTSLFSFVFPLFTLLFSFLC